MAEPGGGACARTVTAGAAVGPERGAAQRRRRGCHDRTSHTFNTRGQRPAKRRRRFLLVATGVASTVKDSAGRPRLVTRKVSCEEAIVVGGTAVAAAAAEVAIGTTAVTVGPSPPPGPANAAAVAGHFHMPIAASAAYQPSSRDTARATAVVAALRPPPDPPPPLPSPPCRKSSTFVRIALGLPAWNVQLHYLLHLAVGICKIFYSRSRGY